MSRPTKYESDARAAKVARLCILLTDRTPGMTPVERLTAVRNLSDELWRHVCLQAGVRPRRVNGVDQFLSETTRRQVIEEFASLALLARGQEIAIRDDLGFFHALSIACNELRSDVAGCPVIAAHDELAARAERLAS